MKRTLFLVLVVLFLVAMPFAAMAAGTVGKGDGGKGGTTTPPPVVEPPVVTPPADTPPDHPQCQGGDFSHERGWRGFHTAFEHSRAFRGIVRDLDGD